MELMHECLFLCVIALALGSAVNAVVELRGMKKDQSAWFFDLSMYFCVIAAAMIWLMRLWF